ncbi:MAG: alpha/beta hydrolase fold domain-containing protein [Thermoguttaceae bacterium]|jgi:acetyl esterase/lipase
MSPGCLIRGVFCSGLLFVSWGAFAAEVDNSDKTGKSPADDLPPHITRLTSFGERADWSPDGKKILFLAKTYGDVYEIDLAAKFIRPVTHHYYHHGYTRALYLANGDILLSGPEEFDPKNPHVSRVQCWLYVLDKSLARPPVPLLTKCSEGPAVSRKRMHIAWAHVAEQYPDELAKGQSRIQEADIVYENGAPKLANQKIVVESRDLPFKCTLEPQNFRPPEERELTFSAYGYQGTEVCGIDLVTKKVVNYSNAPGQYDEPEGIFPDGQYTCVECDRQNHKGSNYVDLWKLKLDGSGQTERMTYFSDYPGYKSSNPVVSDDGRYMAFQMAKSKDQAGVGYGIFIYDFAQAPVSPQQTPASSAQTQVPIAKDLPGVKSLRDLEYARAGEISLLLDLYLPEKSQGPLPLIIWIHGGAWLGGDKADCPARRMLQRGYAVASINYRLSNQAVFPAQIEDCKAAVRWLRAHAGQYGLDPEHFGAWGSSAGGHLVALLGATGHVKEFDKGENLDLSSSVQAVCDYYGPTDLLQIQAHMLPGAPMKHDTPSSPESRLIGGPIQENKDKAARANPIAYVTPAAAPFLIVHGDQDPLVPYNQSELLFEALKKAGVSVRLHIIEGAGHGPGFGGPDVAELVNAFFDRHLNGIGGDEKKDAAITRGKAPGQ